MTTNIELYYVIKDSGDGEASVKFFKTEEAQVAYMEFLEDYGDSYGYKLGDGEINQGTFDRALDIADIVKMKLEQ